MDQAPPRIGISACLLGEPVRFDGGHKRDPFLVQTFGRLVEWVPVCPEDEAGLGTPREPMRLVLVGRAVRGRGEPFDAAAIAVVQNKSGRDLTSALGRYSARRVEALARDNLSGYVLKKDSPSCGMERVKVYSSSGPAKRGGRGLFAEALMRRLPDLPVEEEGRMTDPRLRENFVERVFAYQRLRRLFDSRWTVGDLVRFHTAHTLTLLAHSPSAYRELGRLVADGGRVGRRELERRYQSGFMRALAVVATPRRHASVPRELALRNHV